MALFERSKDDGIAFFRKYYDYDDALYKKFMQVPSHLRLACNHCRNEYGLNLFLREESPVEDCTDSFCADKTLTVSSLKFIKPSFYGGPAFNSKLVRSSAQVHYKATRLLRTQERAERHRYMIAHNSLKGYKQRFVYTQKEDYVDSDFDDDKESDEYYDEYTGRSFLRYPPANIVYKGKSPLECVFIEASLLDFPKSKRPVVGLNPERFIRKCQSCQDYLHGCVYGELFCIKCKVGID